MLLSVPMKVRSAAQHLKAKLVPQVLRYAPRRTDLPLSLWDLSRDAKGALLLRGRNVDSLLAEFGSPLFVVDGEKLDQNAAAFTSVPKGAASGIECFYSYKTNPVPAVLARLHERGIGAEVISEFELWLAQELGMPGERIVMNGPGRTVNALRRGIEIGALVCINHREEIALVADIARRLGKRARVGLRVVPSAGWSNQFGEALQGDAALDAYRALASHPELEIEALHAHLGAELSSEGAVASFVNELLNFRQRLQRELGLCPPILDVGGSLGCRTTTSISPRAFKLNSAFGVDIIPRDPATVLDIAGYVASVVSTVEARCRADGLPRPRIFAEPGRAMTSNTQHLLCRVTTIKQSGAVLRAHAVLDAGINVAEPVRNEYHQIIPLVQRRAAERHYRLVGPICTPMDTLTWSSRLPELSPGDGLAIMDAGAYFVPFSTSFSFPRPGIVMLERDGSVRICRRAETFDDLVSRDRFPGRPLGS